MPEPEFSAAELAAATGGVWTPSAPMASLGIFTDTRQSGRGRLFIALKGEKFDGHDFLHLAETAGAEALCIASDRASDVATALPLLIVPDTLKAYQDIARMHRLRFPGLKVAAVTGSVGKTSVKEMLRAIFTAASGEAAVLYTLGNTNNQFGVPANLLRLTPEHRFAVIEMGTSSPGEIAPLSYAAAPDAAVVNTVAPCHLEHLGDLDGVAREKGMIYAYLNHSGVAVIPGACPQRPILEAAASGRQIVFFGDVPGSCCRTAYCSGTLEGSSFELVFSTGERFKVEWGLTGEHQAANAAAAAAVAVSLGVAPAVIASGLAATVLPGMRMKRTKVDGVTYINDAYNANPASMHAALSQLKESTTPEKLVLVLGGMRELGPGSEAAHQELLRWVQETFPGVRGVLIGPEFAGVSGFPCFATAQEAAPAVAELARPGDLVFAKGSRGNAVELALPEAAR